MRPRVCDLCVQQECGVQRARLLHAYIQHERNERLLNKVKLAASDNDV